MKVLVFGGNGFIGRAVVKAFSDGNDVYSTSRDQPTTDKSFNVDLLNRGKVVDLLAKLKPDVIVNCAGVVENSPSAKRNIEFTKNILSAVVELKAPLKSIIICGSAAEYGEVDEDNLPVKESAPLNAANNYALSKKHESELALEYRQKHNLPITVIKIFNPIGDGMNSKFLIPAIVRQINAIENGEKRSIEINRLDSRRDYVDVSDVAEAIKEIAQGQPKFEIYNVGSGSSTANSRLIDIALKYSSLRQKPVIVETQANPEPVYAVQADISRISNEFGWKPKRRIEDTVKEVVHAAGKR